MESAAPGDGRPDGLVAEPGRPEEHGNPGYPPAPTVIVPAASPRHTRESCLGGPGGQPSWSTSSRTRHRARGRSLTGCVIDSTGDVTRDYRAEGGPDHAPSSPIPGELGPGTAIPVGETSDRRPRRGLSRRPPATGPGHPERPVGDDWSSYTADPASATSRGLRNRTLVRRQAGPACRPTARPARRARVDPLLSTGVCSARSSPTADRNLSRGRSLPTTGPAGHARSPIASRCADQVTDLREVRMNVAGQVSSRRRPWITS